MTTPPPADLGTAGTALWAAVVGSYELAPHEQQLLRSAARHRDMIDRLEELLEESLMVVGSQGQMRLSPAVGELRAARLALSKLLLDLGLPVDSGEGEAPKLASPASRKAKAAAHARHDRERRRIVHAVDTDGAA